MPQFCSKYSVIETSQAFSNTEVAFVEFSPFCRSILPALGFVLGVFFSHIQGTGINPQCMQTKVRKTCQGHMMISEKPNSRGSIEGGSRRNSRSKVLGAGPDFISNQLVDQPNACHTKVFIDE